MQYVSGDRSKGVLFAFRGTTEEKSHTFKLKGFEAKKRYQLSYEDGSGKTVTLAGKQLMDEGLTLTLPDLNSSELVFFRSP
jgi:hypothetical protein